MNYVMMQENIWKLKQLNAMEGIAFVVFQTRQQECTVTLKGFIQCTETIKKALLSSKATFTLSLKSLGLSKVCAFLCSEVLEEAVCFLQQDNGHYFQLKVKATKRRRKGKSNDSCS